MVGEIDSVSQLPSDRSCIFRTTNSNWDGALPSTYTPYARFRSSHSGAYSFWLGVDTDQKMWFARHLPNDGIPTISEWREVAVAEPPQEFDLPPADGWTHTHTWDKSCYCKTQENIVIVHFALDNSNATEPPDAGYIIAYLPEGFRPSAAVIGTCGDYNHSGENLYQCWVTTDGAIIVHSPEVVPRGASGTIVFIAAG